MLATDGAAASGAVLKAAVDNLGPGQAPGFWLATIGLAGSAVARAIPNTTEECSVLLAATARHTTYVAEARSRPVQTPPFTYVFRLPAMSQQLLHIRRKPGQRLPQFASIPAPLCRLSREEGHAPSFARNPGMPQPVASGRIAGHPAGWS